MASPQDPRARLVRPPAPWRGPALAAVLSLPLAYLIAGRLESLASRGLVPLTDRAAALIAVCLLVLPTALAAGPRPLRGVVLATAAAGLAALALPVLLGRPAPIAQGLLAGALMVAVSTFVIGACAGLLMRFTRDPSSALGWVLAVVLVLAAAPLWLAGPLDRGAPLAGWLVAVNPLTALGLAGAVDYPRDDWLYRQSPLGSIRYTYPSLAVLCLAYLSIGSAALAAAHRLGDRARRAATGPDSSLANQLESPA
ncbi:hypothetical protein [Candidatus Thiodictyon syntrophicum]|uniref:Uncharacterized protein n=1 Tax=Candidatus Thiodictyon syntrophicum TaxID=1166950 RepID=A0A2K8U946_9GAMM|nr:hypothetical protein [Candidatus Thiodictyon syntrophicum]AUB82112.1 hypothetical protein THSYN_14915 [Candidatus Thiodictyon syntrophicum]